ncbi:O-methyltransferase-domain-containing protein [Mycena olivaceomarginata]|nr:O-methyltransferase-domain-containing protein [Mycena olivaceomarginata]
MSDLRVLGELIIESIKTIESRFNHEDIDFPALANPFNGERKAESILLEPEISTARSYIVAAASQLIAMVRSPVQTMVENGSGGFNKFHLPSCIRAAVESNMVEIIREAGSQGIHANDIAKKNNTDPTKAESTHSVKIQPASAFQHFRDLCAHINAGFKGSAHLTEAFTHRDTAHSTRATDSPWNIAAQTNAFLLTAQNLNLRRPSLLDSSGVNFPRPRSSSISEGGVGSTTLIIANAVPQAKFVVQDRSSVIEDAKTYWAQTAPQLLRSGRVTLEVHDFFEPQPRRETAVFLLRWVMHDWADPSAVRILKHLRDAATPSN